MNTYIHTSFLDPLCLTNEVQKIGAQKKKKLIAENMQRMANAC